MNQTIAALKNIFRGIFAALLFTGCSPPSAPDASRAGNTPDKKSLDPQQAQPSDVRQRQVTFLNKVRPADPQTNTMERALLNEKNELGLILDPRVEMSSVSAFMRTTLSQMAGAFPGQDITIVAYTASGEARKVGTAHLNVRTGDLTYTPESMP